MSPDYNGKAQREWRDKGRLLKPRIVRTPSEVRTRLVLWALVAVFAAAFWAFIAYILPAIGKTMRNMP